jgi:hypothetical protein
MNTGAGKTPAGTARYPSHGIFITDIGELAAFRALKMARPENTEDRFGLIFITLILIWFAETGSTGGICCDKLR